MRISLSKFLSIIIAVLIGAAAGYSVASEPKGRLEHSNHQASQLSIPLEHGQSAFAAIAEIVSILENDPSTDWSKVNINALTEHLRDMSLLTLNSRVFSQRTASSVIFEVTGDAGVIRALQNMVPAHANELDKMQQWNVTGEATDNGAVLTVVPVKKSDLTRVQALGFFGLMATGAHHQPHHLGMSKGTTLHQH